MNVLHIIPQSVKDENLHFHGSTKDIKCRTEYFLSRGVKVTEVVVKRADDDIINNVKNLDLSTYSVIMLDVCRSFPKALRHLRETAPGAKIILRSINAEPFHRMDWLMASSGFLEKLLLGKRLFGLLKNDILAARSADYIFAISKWDTNYYWRLIAGKNKVLNVPYFVPVNYIESVGNSDIKENLCVCLTSVQVDGNPIIVDAARNFSAIVSKLKNRCMDWEFTMTGDVKHLNFISSRIRKTGKLETPFDLLCRARAVAILSDYGRGFKTKILDAIQAKAYVLVTPGLYRRLPEEVLPFCISVRNGSVESFEQALNRCLAPYPALDANKILRDQAFQNMDKALSGMGLVR
jgi:hypothetical protein